MQIEQRISSKEAVKAEIGTWLNRLQKQRFTGRCVLTLTWSEGGIGKSRISLDQGLLKK